MAIGFSFTTAEGEHVICKSSRLETQSHPSSITINLLCRAVAQAHLLAVSVRSSHRGASGRSQPFFTCSPPSSPAAPALTRRAPSLFLCPERTSATCAGRRVARDAERALPSRRRVASTAASRSAAMSTRPPASTQSALSGGIGERAASHSQRAPNASASPTSCFCFSFPLLKPFPNNGVICIQIPF